MFLGVTNYQHFGGRHWDTAAMKNLMAHAAVTAPHTGQPFSEALCLGIAGGIGAGYSFCPSIPKYDLQFGEQLAGRPLQSEDNEEYYSRLYSCGSGLSVVGRFRVYTTGADYYDGFFDRLGVKTTVAESGGVKAGLKNLIKVLESGKPAVVWCAPMRTSFLGLSGTCGMYSMIVYGIDEEKGEAYIGDRAPTALTIPLEELAWLRNKVCSHKNRILTFEPPQKLSVTVLKKAVIDGIKTCIDEMLKPKMKTYGLPGLREWSKVITSPHNQKGWPRVYPGGRIYLALRDTFDSIETSGTGGGLFRPMYAQFLEEATELTGKKALASCAKTYHQLSAQWRDLAETALPEKVKPFRRTKDLLRIRLKLFEEQGQQAIQELESITDELRRIEVGQRKQLALDGNATADLLVELQEKIVNLHAAELAAAEALKKVVSRV